MARARSVHAVDVFQSGLLFRFTILVAFIVSDSPASGCEEVSPERSLVWGPGLSPDAVVPVRFFYIQAVNSKGENLTISPGNSVCFWSNMPPPVFVLFVFFLVTLLLFFLQAKPKLIADIFLKNLFHNVPGSGALAFYCQ